MEGLMAKSLLDGEEDLAPPASVRSSPLTRAGNSRSENIAESPTGPCNTSSEVRSQDVPEAEPSPLSLSAEISEGAPLGDAPSVPQQGPSQHRTTGLDLGLMSSPPISTLPFADVGSRQSRLVHAAFGSNTLAHREWRIDLVTAISVLLILVKLPAIHGAFWFTTVGYLVISGWMSVQLLLLLFHIKDVGDLDVANSVRTAQLLDDKLQKEAIFWKAVYAAFHLPILSYLSYLLTFHLTFPHWLSWLGNIFQGILVIMATIIFYLSLLAVMICIFAGLRFLVLTIIRCAYPDNSQDEGPCYNLRNGLLLLLLALPVLIWLGTANLTYARKTRPTHRFNNNGTYHPIFTNPTLDMLVDSGYRKIVAGIWLLLILVWLTLIFCFTFFFQFEEGSAGKRSLRKRVSVGNALIAVAVFIWYIVTYDPIGTRKPDWLEWLG
ncbi:MAG: hypothetical protein M1839_006817 [Geoglossum umbratile]|nr:MAG: hypothetical protein M1839_006817 [Geoglossum umbratile]